MFKSKLNYTKLLFPPFPTLWSLFVTIPVSGFGLFCMVQGYYDDRRGSWLRCWLAGWLVGFNLVAFAHGKWNKNKLINLVLDFHVLLTGFNLNILYILYTIVELTHSEWLSNNRNRHNSNSFFKVTITKRLQNTLLLTIINYW